MLERLRDLAERARGEDEEEEAPHAELAPLRFLAAQILLVTGIGATLELRERVRRASEDARPYHPGHLGMAMTTVPARPGTWAPALVAPLAALAHVVHGTRPSPSTDAATRVLDAATIGVGLLGFGAALLDGRSRASALPLAPVALASAGALGILLRRESNALAEERARLERRADLVERLVPKRRARLDRIVVHV